MQQAAGTRRGQKSLPLAHFSLKQKAPDCCLAHFWDAVEREIYANAGAEVFVILERRGREEGEGLRGLLSGQVLISIACFFGQRV